MVGKAKNVIREWADTTMCGLTARKEHCVRNPIDHFRTTQVLCYEVFSQNQSSWKVDEKLLNDPGIVFNSSYWKWEFSTTRGTIDPCTPPRSWRVCCFVVDEEPPTKRARDDPARPLKMLMPCKMPSKKQDAENIGADSPIHVGRFQRISRAIPLHPFCICWRLNCSILSIDWIVY